MNRQPFLKNMRDWAVFWLLVLALWQAASFAANNPFIVPSPLQVLEQMVQIAGRDSFWAAMSATTLRALGALAISFVLGMAAAALSFFVPALKGVLMRLVTLLQSIPNISYMIVLLFWLGRVQTVLAMGCFLVFPLVCRSLLEQMEAIRNEWKDVWTIYPQPAGVLLFRCVLPQLRPTLCASLKSGISMSFKVTVMTEILAGISVGIGKSMQHARLDLNLAGVLAWSLWLVFLVFAAEWAAGLLFGMKTPKSRQNERSLTK